MRVLTFRTHRYRAYAPTRTDQNVGLHVGSVRVWIRSTSHGGVKQLHQTHMEGPIVDRSRATGSRGATAT